MSKKEVYPKIQLGSTIKATISSDYGDPYIDYDSRNTKIYIHQRATYTYLGQDNTIYITPEIADKLYYALGRVLDIIDEEKEQ
jgi:hypothetical protein